jgi:hypothetical protein
MGCDVYANNDEIACKAGDGKVIAAFPDVCLSPPSPPTGPVPVPYPDTSFSRDMQNGSKTVVIKGQEVMLKDQSFYKTSPLGDEAATNSLGAGVVTHVITGKTYFVAWSMDVKFEGQNVDRHSDLTTSNHASIPGNVPSPFPNMASFMQAFTEANLCPCCQGVTHSRGPVVSEGQFYGSEDVLCEDAAGNVQVLEKDPAAERLMNEIRGGPCKHLLPDPPCNVYRVTTTDERDKIEEKWNSYRVKYKEKKGIPAGTSIAHRTPKAAGGCPKGEGNLAVRGEQCEPLDQRLGDRQSQRINALRGLGCTTYH